MNKLRSILSLIGSGIKGEEQDYTQLNLRSSIVLLATPMIIEMMMESLFAVVDAFFVGRLGAEALATVGLTESVLFIVYSVGMGISMAGTALVARRFGEKKYRQAGSTTFQLIFTGLIMALIMAGTAFYYAEDILRLMGASEQIISYGAGYTQIIFAGNIPILLLFLINGAFRGAGQPHIAMQTLWISNGLNIILDPLLIFGIGSIEGLGLEGAAWASTIGRSLGVCYQLYHLLNGKHLLKVTRINLVIRMKTIWNILKVSSGGIMQFLVDSASWIFLYRIVSSFGTEAVAGYTIAFRVIIFALLPAWGLSSAAATLVGQNLGAKKYRRAELSVWLTVKYNVIFLAVITTVFLLFGKYIAYIFSDNPDVISVATESLQIISLGYVFFGLGMVMIQAFNGAGDTRTPTYVNILVLWFMEIPLAYFMAYHLQMGLTGVFVAIATCHSLHALVSWGLYRRGNWKKVKV